MSLWAKAQQLPQECLQQLRNFYGNRFPIEVRHYLASYIEEHFWIDQNHAPEDPQYQQYVATLINALISEIETRASTNDNENMWLIKIKLTEAAKGFRQENPMDLFNVIRQCLAFEMNLVQTSNGEFSGIMVPNLGAETQRKLNNLRSRISETAEDLRKMSQEGEAFAIQYHECTKYNAHIRSLQNQANDPKSMQMVQDCERRKELIETALNNKVATLMQMKLSLSENLKSIIQELGLVQTHVLDEELIRWKREQQLAGNGAHFNTTTLDTIQEWCENLAELIWTARQQIKETEAIKQKFPLELPIQDILPQLQVEVTQLLSTLVTSTFIIEKQPPQVMKTNTRFTATVRLLVGGKLGVHMSPPQVKVTIISEQQANMRIKKDSNNKLSDSSGEILNNTGTMEYQQTTRQLSVSFRNMQLKKIKRAEKKGTESVMDEKFCLLFQSQFSVGGGELVFQVWTLGLPVVVIVHGNQEPHAWATVTWDNAFSEPGREPFKVPDKIPWPKVAEALSIKFQSATNRALTEDNLRFLAEKAFRGQYNENANPMLTWAQFCKEPLSERNFTFWEWFFAIMKLTREHLKGPWMDGAIMGFVRKNKAEEMLSTKCSGTFLLRFSDSELGGITIAWVSENGEVFSLQPFTSKDMTIRALPDRIADLNYLVCLYPDTPKQIPFEKYYTPYTDAQTTTTGYVRPLLVTHVPGWSGTTNYSNTTPQHYMSHMSPDPTRDTPSVASSFLQF
ncbi:unnamed protein product [Brassicogethes aeneus]|uniref:Signal transducer and activator of transcription n=1 Tax=Brassicogethes aeneus TaxID=1431903 RepID=A0A9P0FI34_BRAAE|nr:unnamed protein product [Brassicogethes aeneus]